MRQVPFLKIKTFAVTIISLLVVSVSYGQSDALKSDLISKEAAEAANLSYKTFVKSIKPDGLKTANKATTQVVLPVDKLKEIVDACTIHGVTKVSAMFIWINDSNAKFARAADGSKAPSGFQTLIFKVPASAFPGQTGAKINSTSSPLMLSLLGAGLVLLDQSETGLPYAGDLYFAIGSICPPPASCD